MLVCGDAPLETRRLSAVDAGPLSVCSPVAGLRLNLISILTPSHESRLSPFFCLSFSRVSPSESGDILTLRLCCDADAGSFSCCSCLFQFQYIRSLPACGGKGGGLWILLIPFVHQTQIDIAAEQSSIFTVVYGCDGMIRFSDHRWRAE